jgi:hypothetical protein
MSNKSIIPTQYGTQQSYSHEIVYFDEDNPESLINKMPEPLKNSLLDPLTCKFLAMPFAERKKKIKPDTTTNRLRVSFWREFELAMENGRPMSLANIHIGVCAFESFMDIIKNPEYFAWIVTPTTAYVNLMEEGLNFGLERMREILEMPLYTKKSIKIGNNTRITTVPNIQVANLIVNVVKMLDNRVKGAVVKTIHQKVEQKNLNINTEMRRNDDGSFDFDSVPLDVLEGMVNKEIRRDDIKTVDIDTFRNYADEVIDEINADELDSDE